MLKGNTENSPMVFGMGAMFAVRWVGFAEVGMRLKKFRLQRL